MGNLQLLFCQFRVKQETNLLRSAKKNNILIAFPSLLYRSIMHYGVFGIWCLKVKYITFHIYSSTANGLSTFGCWGGCTLL